jgi:pimeloyl-ACP methyl ester carboxylesterase
MRLSANALLLLFLVAPRVAAQPLPRFEAGPCPFEGGDWLQREQIECGRLLVPENRDRPDGRTLRLAVAVLRSRDADPRPDPVVFLSGGPGGAAVRFAASFSTSPMVRAIREERDFILWDQRGTGYSDPDFCPDKSAELLAVDYGTLVDEDRLTAALRLVSECRERMLEEGLDFSAYNSVTSARDLDDLRRTLGYERWNLLGVSYGTRLALTAARDVPEGIRGMILDSTSPPSVAGDDYMVANFARSLDLVFRQCEADEACRRLFPDPEAEFYAAIDELNAEPLEIPMADTARFPAGRVILDGRTFALGFFQGLYSRHFIPLAPHAIRQMRQRNLDLLAALADALAPDPQTENPWLGYSVECYEQAPLLSVANEAEIGAQYPRLGLIRDTIFLPVCEAWHGVRADTALLRRPITSDIPTLVAAGEFDPITPPRYGQLVADELPHSQYVEVRGMGHGTLPFTACTRGLVVAFLEEPDSPLDTSCLAELPAVGFITDLHIAPEVGAALGRFAIEPEGGLIIWAGGTLLLLASGLLGWTATAVVRRLRRRPRLPRDGSRLARWLAGLAALAAIGFVVGLVLLVRGVPASNPYVLAFGIPGSAAPLLWLPWLFLTLTVAVVVLVVPAWRRGWWGRVGRIHYSLVVAACVSFAVLLMSQGLL